MGSEIHEGHSQLVQIDAHQRLQELHCGESGNVKSHISKMIQYREELAGMGASVQDTDFVAMIMSSLPESYRPLLSSMSAAAKIAKAPITSDQLISQIMEEADHRSIQQS